MNSKEGKKMNKKKLNRIPILVLLALSIAIGAVGCAQPSAYAEEAKSDLDRVSSPNVGASDLEKLVEGNSAFALDLYQALREQGENIFYSPYSISIALAMTYAGARGETETQMAETLYFTLSQDRLHPAFNALDLELSKLGENVAEEEGDPFRLNIANSIWGQQDFEFLSEFLDTLALNYGAGLRLVDFIEATEEARQAINQWVEDQTEDKIKNLIPEGVLDSMTRLVLANAIYFNAGWMNPFEEGNTQDGSFYLLDGSQVTAPFMSQDENFRYAEGEGYQVVELPYVGGDTSMLILLPEVDQFSEFEASLSSMRVNEILDDLEMNNVRLSMPKFEVESSFSLKETLSAMGMRDAFENADFSGINGEKDLFISEILHKAFVSVDEEGTEAAAATAVIISLTAMPEAPVEMTLDHPFIFMIRDNVSGTILFMGRVMNPAS
jgi:serpin B